MKPAYFSFVALETIVPKVSKPMRILAKLPLSHCLQPISIDPGVSASCFTGANQVLLEFPTQQGCCFSFYEFFVVEISSNLNFGDYMFLEGGCGQLELVFLLLCLYIFV